MLSVLLALGAAASYGTADYLGGLASRGSSAVRVLLCSHGCTLAVLAVLIFAVPAPLVTGRDLAWAAGGAAFSALGVGLLYRGLAGGPMAIVSPITAVLSAAVPVVVGIVGGGPLTALDWAGIGFGLAATVLVSMSSTSTQPFRDPRWKTVLIAVAAGVTIGVFMTMMAQCSPQARLMPMFVVRCLTTLMLFVAAVASVRSIRPRRLLPAHKGLAAVAGILDTGGTSLFMLAAATGSLSIAGVLAAQFPVLTVALARWRLKEYLTRRQIVGLVAALISVALFALAT